MQKELLPLCIFFGFPFLDREPKLNRNSWKLRYTNCLKNSMNRYCTRKQGAAQKMGDDAVPP